MNLERKIQWFLIAATAGLLVFLKWMHYGVTHYNWFLLILMAWSLGLIIAFRALGNMNPQDDPGSGD